MNYKTILISILLVTPFFYLSAEVQKVDFTEVENIQYSKPNEACSLLEKLIKNKNLDIEDEMYYNRLHANIRWQLGKMDSSIYFYRIVANLAFKNNDIKELSSANADIGYVYADLGQTDSAIIYIQKSILLAEKLENKNVLYRNKTFLSHVFMEIGEMDKALALEKECLAYFTNKKNEYYKSIILNNIGNCYMQMDKIDSALAYLRKAYVALHKRGDTEKFAMIFLNYSICFDQLGQLDSSEYYILKSIELFEENKNIYYIPASKIKYANLLDKMGKHDEAIKVFETSLNEMLDGEVNNSMLELFYYNMAKTYSKVGKLEKAYEFLDKYVSFKDSMEIVDKNNLVRELEAKFQNKQKRKEILKLNGEKKQQKVILIIVAIGLVVFAILIIIIYNRLKVTRKQKIIIQETNEELNQTNEELAAQRDEIESQKEVVELAHEEIKDSINYAKRIQNAILPAVSVIKKSFPESFVLYQPKDVVAGDFYWFEQRGNITLFAAADCTGHGVPGAMVSVVCHNAMNRAVREFGLTEPGLILDKTREIVVEEFEKSEDDVKDGMDIALCSLKVKTNGDSFLQYAGAHNPLWIVRNNEILEIKADKQPIGKFDDPVPYTTHTIELEKGDSVYVFSDGYADQFGGPKDKKLGSKRFKELLISIQDKPMEDQKSVLKSTLKDWMNDSGAEQLDDICIMGVKIS